MNTFILILDYLYNNNKYLFYYYMNNLELANYYVNNKNEFMAEAGHEKLLIGLKKHIKIIDDITPTEKKNEK